jgi:hypothetical protein
MTYTVFDDLIRIKCGYLKKGNKRQLLFNQKVAFVT